MMTTFLDAPGLIGQVTDFRVNKAIALAQALSQQTIAYASFIECRLTSDADVVVFEVQVEVPQCPINPINRVERIAAIFSESEENIPEVLALRSDFPRVPHLNLGVNTVPRNLCLYEELYRDLKRRWTAPRFVGRIRQWLALTAKGILHQDDQPLEPLLSGYAGHIILPRYLLKSTEGHLPERLYLTATDTLRFLVAHNEKPSEPINCLPIAVSVHHCPPQQHGIIQARPSSLTELALIFHELRYEFLDELRVRLKKWWQSGLLNAETQQSPLILVTVCPKTREVGSVAESSDIWVFITNYTLEKIGEKIGLWQSSGGHLCPLAILDETKQGEDVHLDLLNPSFQLDRDSIAELNGHQGGSTLSIAAVGLGALGSQVVMNLVRNGFGKWVFIDDDRLMPHNIARHALNELHIGWQKSVTMAEEAKRIFREDNAFSAIPIDVMTKGEKATLISDALNNSELILDLSASVTVARFLALDAESSARRISLFLNPTGDDLVMLAEDVARSLKLDQLEMQYYRSLTTEESLAGHFKPSQSRRRYGQSCRDITSKLPQDLVALHSAIASRAIREAALSADARISIWRADSLGNVRRLDVLPYPAARHRTANWTVSMDVKLLDKLHKLRADKLPNETGGVLLGSFDLERHIVYIVDTIPSPPDSEEWPTLYIRGCKGLKLLVDRVAQETDGSLEYIGEWHSHPAAAPTAPSNDDQQVFTWLADLMGRDGLPGIMIIVGDYGRVSCFIGEIDSYENLFPTSVRACEV